MFQIGDKVQVLCRDHQLFDGVVVSVFKRLSGALRYVIEDDHGQLHIFGEPNLQKSEQQPPPARAG